MKEETYSRDIHIIENIAADVVSIHATVLSFALFYRDEVFNTGIDVWNGGYYRTIETIRATNAPCFMIPSYQCNPIGPTEAGKLGIHQIGWTVAYRAFSARRSEIVSKL